MLPLKEEEEATERAWVCREGLQGQKVRNDKSWFQGLVKSWAFYGHPDSGQLQELLQCVLLHSLHEEFIVLREGGREGGSLLSQEAGHPSCLPRSAPGCNPPTPPRTQTPYPTVVVPVDNLRWGSFGVASQGSHLISKGVVLRDVH